MADIIDKQKKTSGNNATLFNIADREYLNGIPEYAQFRSRLCMGQWYAMNIDNELFLLQEGIRRSTDRSTEHYLPWASHIKSFKSKDLMQIRNDILTEMGYDPIESSYDIVNVIMKLLMDLKRVFVYETSRYKFQKRIPYGEYFGMVFYTDRDVHCLTKRPNNGKILNNMCGRDIEEFPSDKLQSILISLLPNIPKESKLYTIANDPNLRGAGVDSSQLSHIVWKMLQYLNRIWN